MVFHVDPVGSDHHALVIDCCFSNEKSPRVFRFEANWVTHEGFLQIVKEGWNENGAALEDKVLDLIRRLDSCRRRLERWSKQEFPNFRKLIGHLRHQLSICHEGYLNAANLKEAGDLVRQIELAWDKEEAYWWQRSRIAWLQCGDRNTRFFHSSVIQRRQRNKILRLKDERGVWLEDKREINASFSCFYRKLFSFEGPRELDQALEYVKEVVTVVDNAQLMLPVTNQEIEEAVFQIGANKAPGSFEPD
ncbi:hypothetical protein K1719_004709 [Acacia pycnantha]|nr:hypothetical protein K1719_004709 [Acacia pycnantha]